MNNARKQKGIIFTLSSPVISKASYTFDEFIFGAKFIPMYHSNETNDKTILHLDRLDLFAPEDLPVQF